PVGDGARARRPARARRVPAHRAAGVRGAAHAHDRRRRLTMTPHALALDEIDAFYGDSHVLHGVSFRLGAGRLLGLLGRNGSGKSTSMNVAVGLLSPRRGRVRVFDAEVTGRAPEAIAAQGVALVPQGRRVFRSLTVQ